MKMRSPGMARIDSTSMPRASDRSLVPALVEEDLGDDVDPWEAVAGWAAARPGADAEERLRLLGMAGGVVPAQPPTDRPPTGPPTVRPREGSDERDARAAGT